MRKIILSICLILLLSAAPALGLTYEKEREIAKSYIKALDSAGVMVYEPELNWRLQELTNLLAGQIDHPLYNFKIHVVRDRSVNAFAIPDGQIFIHVGTILFARDLDELAAVIAHEMGHCQLRHIAQMYADGKRLSAAAIAGMLAGAVLSAANPQVGTAVLLSAIGGSQNIQLKYSREYEREADEFGRNILARANIDSAAMGRFLVNLRTFGGGTDVPEFFLTHPYTEERIAAVVKDSGTARPDRRYWQLQAVTAGLLLEKQECLDRAAGFPAPYDRLARGLMLSRSGEWAAAVQLLDGVDEPVAAGYKGLCLYRMGDSQAALPYLTRYHASAETAMALAEILHSNGAAARAVAVLEPFGGSSARAAYVLGNYYKEAGADARAHLAYARYFFRMQNFKAGLYHVDAALEKQAQLDDEMRAELEEMRVIARDARKD